MYLSLCYSVEEQHIRQSVGGGGEEQVERKLGQIVAQPGNQESGKIK